MDNIYPIIVSGLSIIVSGLLGTIITIIYYRRHEKYLMKLETLKKFVSNRFDIIGDPFSRALNEISVVFNQSKEVRDALLAFHNNAGSNNPSTPLANDLLVKLNRAMCKDLGINIEDLTDKFFLTPFNVKKI